MSTIQAPFRADVVGSFLRPQALKSARAQFEAGDITAEQLRQVEDELITDLIAKQKANGLRVITDGEFRRAYWHLDFMWGLQGVVHIEHERGYQFKHVETAKGSAALTGRISGENHPFVEHFKFVQQFAEPGIVARQTLPAPAQSYAELFRGENAKSTAKVYPYHEALVQDLAAAYRTVIADLYAAGCRNIQLDDCTWGMVCDKGFWKLMAGNDYTPVELQEVYLRLNNLVLADQPADLVLTTHVCRGNYDSSWAAEGPYDAVAETLFSREAVDAFYLEYDDERSGGFAPLQHVPAGKKVVLGLVTTKRPELEDKAAIIARIREASQYVPLENLYLSPQCGFASCEVGNKLTEDEQWAKVRLVAEIAQEVWGDSCA